MEAVDAYSNNRIDCFRCSIRMVESCYFLGRCCNDDWWKDDDDCGDCVLRILRKVPAVESHCLIVYCYQIDEVMTDYYSMQNMYYECYCSDDNDYGIQDSNPFLCLILFSLFYLECYRTFPRPRAFFPSSSLLFIYVISFFCSSMFFVQNKLTKGAASTKSIFCEYRISKLTLFYFIFFRLVDFNIGIVSYVLKKKIGFHRFLNRHYAHTHTFFILMILQTVFLFSFSYSIFVSICLIFLHFYSNDIQQLLFLYIHNFQSRL